MLPFLSKLNKIVFDVKIQAKALQNVAYKELYWALGDGIKPYFRVHAPSC